MKNTLVLLSVFGFFSSLLFAQDIVLPAAATAPAPTTVSAPAPASTPAAAPVIVEKPMADIDLKAKKLPVRKGFAEILSAEILQDKPAFTDENEFDPADPFGKDNTIWGQLILLVAEKRSISRVDFVIEWEGTAFPCIAVASGDAPYSMKQDKNAWTIPAERDPKTPVRMLFAFKKDSRLTAVALTDKMKLKRVIGISMIPADWICFRILAPGTKPVTAADVLNHPEGLCGMSSAELQAYLNPATPASAAAPVPAPTAPAATTATPAPAPAAPAATPAPAPAAPAATPAPAPAAPAPAPAPAPALQIQL